MAGDSSKDLSQALARAVKSSPWPASIDKPLPELQPKQAIPPSVGIGLPDLQGVEPPLTEIEDTRTYYPKQTATVSGIDIEAYPIKTMTFVDARGKAVVLNFAKPDLSKDPTAL